MTAYDITLRITFIVLSLVGLYSCFCFARESLAKVFPFLDGGKPVEASCKNGSCILVSQTRWAKIFGVPNWWFGTAFYLVTILGTLWTNPWIISVAIMGALGACLFSLFLIYGLAFKLKAFCKMCYLAHAVNFALLITWFIAIWKATTPV